MQLRVYEKDLTAEGLQAALLTNGLGALTHCTKAEVHQVINGDWSLTLSYPTDAPGAELLTRERLICCDGQLYRITRRKPSSTRTGRVISIEAPHVAYDLTHKYIVNIETKEDDRFPDGITAAQALSRLLAGTGFSAGEVTVDGTVLDYLDVLQKDVMSCVKGQLLDQWGGELEFDNFTIHLRAALGSDRRYPIRDGRNIDEITITEDDEPIITRLHVRGYQNANFEDINGGRDYIDSPHIGKYSFVREGYVDFADDDDPVELLRKGLLEIGKHDLPEISYAIKLAELRGSVQYAAYKRLERYGLGDTAALHTQELDADVILRCSERKIDCLTDRNTFVKLGNTDSKLMSAITAGASASDKLAGVLTPDGFLSAEKVSGVLDLVRVTNFKAAVADIAKLVVGDATLTSAQISDLSAEVARIFVADIDTMDVKWADIASLTAAVAEIAQAKIGSADIDFAHIKDLVAGTSIITKGEAGKLFIANLAVTEANMGSLSVGELLVKGQDGAFYAVSIGEDGQVVTTKKTVAGSDVADGTLGGDKLIEGSVTTRELNVSQIFGDEAVIRVLTASEILTENLKTNILTAGSITASMLDSGVGAALDISSNVAIRLTVKKSEMETTVATLNGAIEGAASTASAAQTAADKAKTDAASAVSTAGTAAGTAGTAKSTAEGAASTASAAKTAADKAKTDATSAVSTAGTAASTASAAKTTAEAAASTASAAVTEAAAASAAAEAAQGTADDAAAAAAANAESITSITERVSTAESKITQQADLISQRVTKTEMETTVTTINGAIADAADAAGTAQSTAEGAASAAGAAASTASAAQTAADKAKTDAASAVSTAGTAASTASTAKSTAEGAASTASAAASTASTAKTTAEGAASTASTAASTASAAKTAADKAKTDAASAVSTAGTAASTASAAKTTAEGAASTAATAKTTAEGAASTASAAKTTAEGAASAAAAASTAAAGAQSTANEAAKALQTVTSRVTTAESRLDQTDSMIQGTVKKTDLETVVDGLATKESLQEIQSQTTQTASELAATVSRLFDTEEGLETYIKRLIFDLSGLHIKSAEHTSTELKLDDTSMQFIDAVGNVCAEITQKLMTIENAKIGQTMQIGNGVWRVLGDGSIGLFKA